MKIGLVNPSLTDVHPSLVHVRYTTAAALASTHDLVACHAEHQFAPPARQRELLKDWMSQCDVILGRGEGRFLRVREELERKPPFGCLMLGTMSRGAGWLVRAHKHLRTSDVLIGNCEADVVLARKFFPNATVRCVPFAFDDALYFPADEAAQAAVRESLGVAPDEPLIVYAGRITLEKNLHAVLKTFRVVLNAVPNARLIIAGDEMPVPFAELGTRFVAMTRTLERLVTRWGLDNGRVQFIGQKDAETLRALYSTAAVLVNLSLNHDENFGLVQIEAMACGLPVVGTTWGGLKDTIHDGVTGARVPAVFTDAGVKVDWWAAATRIVELLAPTEANRRLRERCAAHVRAHYSIEEYARRLDEVVRESADLASRPTECVEPSAFARHYWEICFHRSPASAGGAVPPYRRGADAWDLYRELIVPFAGGPVDTSINGSIDEAAHARGGWCLAMPVTMSKDGTIAVNDPLYPFDVPVPPDLVRSVRRLIRVFAAQPVLDDAALPAGARAGRDALAWMQSAGLVLRTWIGPLDPTYARGAPGDPAFVMRQVDHAADVVYIA